MGLRGPAPKPVELKVLEGNRGNRPLDLSTVFRPEVGLPDAPSWLSREGRKAWKRLSEELLRYNLISRVDRDAFATLCQTIGRLEQVELAIRARQKLAEDKARESGDKCDPIAALLGKTPNGLEVQGAVYQILNREQDKLWRMLDSFGLKPDARAAVSTAIRAQLQLFPNDKPDGGDGDKPAPPAGGGFSAFK